MAFDRGNICIKFDNRKKALNAEFTVEPQDQHVGHFDANLANHSLSLAQALGLDGKTAL